jgi:ketosteroid isomerase-like protein
MIDIVRREAAAGKSLHQMLQEDVLKSFRSEYSFLDWLGPDTGLRSVVRRLIPKSAAAGLEQRLREEGKSVEETNQHGGMSMMEHILRIEDSAMEEWRKGNPMRWVEISADDVVYIDPGLSAPIVGKADYIEYLKPLKGKIFYDGSEYVRPRVAVYGDLAVLTYNYHSLRHDPAGHKQRTSFWNTTEVYAKKDGRWKTVHSHWSLVKGSREGGGV